MPVIFSGFPRLIEPKALKPGRWFMAGGAGGGQLCMLTAVGSDHLALVLMFALGKTDALEFRTARLASLTGPFSTVEDEMVFSPGEGGEKLRLHAAAKKPFPSGSLLRLSSGDMGVGFAEKLNGRLYVVSLSSGQECEGFDLVFERWSLAIRRGAHEALAGHFRGGTFTDAERFERSAR
jgi:hypothetical protein